MSRQNRNKKDTKLETKKKKSEILIFLKNLTNSKQAAFIGALSGIIALITTIIQTSQIFAPYLDNYSKQPFIPNSTSYTKLLVPLYIFPSGDGISQWNAIMEASKRVPITVIVNPDSGPGLCPNPVYSDSIQMLLDNNIETIGYVSTLEGRRDQSDVESDIDTYLDCYNVNGIFIEAKYAATTENLSYYYSLYWYARHKNGMDRNPLPLVFLDTGNIPDEKFYKQYYIEPAFDTAVIFEGSLSPIWEKYKVNNYININHSPPPYSAALIHTTPTISDMQQAINKAIERNIDYIYVTDAIMDNPWYALPSYWDAEVAYIEVLNSNASSQNSYQP